MTFNENLKNDKMSSNKGRKKTVVLSRENAFCPVQSKSIIDRLELNILPKKGIDSWSTIHLHGIELKGNQLYKRGKHYNDNIV